MNLNSYVENKNMEALHFIYEQKHVDFLPSGDDNVMVNATQMAKIFGKEVTHFLENEGTKKFIDACLNTRNSEYLILKSKDDLVSGKQKSGTWMHRVLALKFAAWLDPNFEVWVFMTIDKILMGHYREQKEATAEKLRAEKEVETKKQLLIDKYPEFVDFLLLEGKVNEAEKRRLKAIKESVKQLRLDLFPA